MEVQCTLNLIDRQAAEAVRLRLDWQYALGLELEDEGFDHSVLSEFRAKVAAHGLAERVLDLLLKVLNGKGLAECGSPRPGFRTQQVSGGGRHELK